MIFTICLNYAVSDAGTNEDIVEDVQEESSVEELAQESETVENQNEDTFEIYLEENEVNDDIALEEESSAKELGIFIMYFSGMDIWGWKDTQI